MQTGDQSPQPQHQATFRIAHPADALGAARARWVGSALQAIHPDATLGWVPLASPLSPTAGPETTSPVTGADGLARALQRGIADASVFGAEEWVLRQPTDRAFAVLARSEPRDALVSRGGRAFVYLPQGATVATSGAHRRAQLLRRRRDLSVVLIPNDIGALLALVDSGACDAAVVAASDLSWLGLQDRITELFDTDLMIPAIGQGMLVVEAPAEMADTIAPLHDVATAYALQAEQACLRRLAPPAEAAVAVHATVEGEDVLMYGIVAEPDGSHVARLRWRGPCRAAEETGTTMAELLLAAGGREILAGLPLESTGRYTFRVARDRS